jgi:predicted CoA-binding protein
MNREALYGSTEVIDAVLAMELWFVVGLGDNPERVAHHVAHDMQAKGKKIVPIHPRAEIVHGEQGFRTIAEAAAVHGAPDVVDCFVRSSRAGEFADQAIIAGAKAVWFQLGVSDEAAAQRVLDAGLLMVMDTCPLIEWRSRGVSI